MSRKISIIIPALNEADGIVPTLTRVKEIATKEMWDLELIVVDDGSTDSTGELAKKEGAIIVRHPRNGGYGLSLQDGIRVSTADLIAITDADGTYPIEELPKLVSMIDEGYDMAVGARTGAEYRQSWWKYPARIAFRLLAEYVAGRRIPDINSGLRVMRREKLMPHYTNTCYGFSFTTSITLIFFLCGYFVGYTPIPYAARIGKTKVRHLWDTLRTGQIMVSVIIRYNPIKLFLLMALMCLAGACVAWVLSVALGSFWLSAATAGLVAATPIVFALGCVAEAVRFNRPSR